MDKTLLILLAFTMGIPFPFCLCRMKKFGISLPIMLLIYVAVSLCGLIGARVGSAAAGGALAGKRLYGLMIFDTGAILILSKLLKITIGNLGDFVAVPIMAVCASAKLDCLLNDCCAGFCMFYEGSTPVLFPSAILEMIVWSIFVVLLLLIERKQFASGILWPISMIWFGAARFLFDYFRGSIWERKPFFLTMSAGQFWSLVALLIGAVFLFFTLRKKLERKPRPAELLKSIFGMRIIQDFKDAET